MGVLHEHDTTRIDEVESEIEAGTFQWRADREDVHMNVEVRTSLPQVTSTHELRVGLHTLSLLSCQ